MKFLLVVFFSLLAAAQDVTVATATYRPISVSGTADVFGSNSKVSVWEINICSNQPTTISLPRQRIMQAAPEIREIPNKMAQDLFARHAYGDKRSILARWAPQVMVIAGAYFTAYGIAKSDKIKMLAGYAGGTTGLLSQVLTERAPNPSPYFNDLMADVVNLGPIQCATAYVAASLMPKAMPIGPVDIKLPR